MASDNEDYHSESEFYYPDEDFRPFPSDPVGKTVPSISRPLAQFFPMRSSRTANNINLTPICNHNNAA